MNAQHIQLPSSLFTGSLGGFLCVAIQQNAKLAVTHRVGVERCLLSIMESESLFEPIWYLTVSAALFLKSAEPITGSWRYESRWHKQRRAITPLFMASYEKSSRIRRYHCCQPFFSCSTMSHLLNYICRGKKRQYFATSVLDSPLDSYCTQVFACSAKHAERDVSLHEANPSHVVLLLSVQPESGSDVVIKNDRESAYLSFKENYAAIKELLIALCNNKSISDNKSCSSDPENTATKNDM